MVKKIYLGKVRNEIKTDKQYNPIYCEGENIYITKHSWDCGWYWGFGYIGNSKCHMHFEQTFLGKNIWLGVDEIFEKTWIKEKQWWILKDLFVQAYALKKCAEVFRHGGYCTTEKGITDIIQNKNEEVFLNNQLEIVLDKIWELLETWEEENK